MGDVSVQVKGMAVMQFGKENDRRWTCYEVLGTFQTEQFLPELSLPLSLCSPPSMLMVALSSAATKHTHTHASSGVSLISSNMDRLPQMKYAAPGQFIFHFLIKWYIKLTSSVKLSQTMLSGLATSFFFQHTPYVNLTYESFHVYLMHLLNRLQYILYIIGSVYNNNNCV